MLHNRGGESAGGNHITGLLISYGISDRYGAPSHSQPGYLYLMSARPVSGDPTVCTEKIAVGL